MHIYAPLEGVVPLALGPVVSDVQIRFSADPWQACRIPSQAVIAVVAGQNDAWHSAGIGVTEIRTRDVNADFPLNRLTTVGVVRHIPIVVNACADLRDHSRGKDMIVVDRHVPITLLAVP